MCATEHNHTIKIRGQIENDEMTLSEKASIGNVDHFFFDVEQFWCCVIVNYLVIPDASQTP